MLPWILLFSACTEFAPGTEAASTRITAPPSRVDNLAAAASGDLDGDGDVDLVTIFGAPRYNDGAGHFTGGVITWHGAPNGPSAVTVADMDGDGTDDVIGSWSNVVAIAYGGPAGPTDGQPLAGTWSSAYDLRRVGDTDGDGRDEVAARTSYSAPERWAFFDLDHGYAAWTGTHTEYGALAATGDSDGDGIDDVALGEVTLFRASQPVRGVVWQAGATIGPVPREDPASPTDLDPNPMLADWTWSGAGPDDATMSAPAHGQRLAGPGDLDGDGLGDLVGVNSAIDGWLTFFAGRSAQDGGGFEAVGQLRASGSDDLSVALMVGADLDGDGTRELIASANVHGQVVLMAFEAGPGVVHPERLIDLSFLLSDASIRTLLSPGDLDGDGTDDLVVDGWLLFGERFRCGGPKAWYLDNDGDGFPSDTHVVWTCSRPAGAWPIPGGDCDDDDPAAFPGAWEYVGGDDLACDGTVYCYPDDDRDGYGGEPRPFDGFRCDGQLPLGWLDCYDDDDLRHPGVVEAAGNDADEDCDGRISCYADADQDGYGSRGTVDVRGGTCDDPSRGLSANNTDCSDQEPTQHDIVTVYADRDGDGYGGRTTVQRCAPLAGETLLPGDCDDSDPATWPGPAELIGGGDENCDQYMDCYRDADHDGIGSAQVTTVLMSYLGGTCDTGYVGLSNVTGDCDDADATLGLAVLGSPTTYPDADGDGWGDVTQPSSCGPGGQRTFLAGDCDDNDDRAYPGSLYERQGGPDIDCDGLIACFADEDGDLHPDYDHEVLVAQAACDVFPPGAGDCNDAEPEAWNTHVEVIGDGIDNNCNGVFGPALTIEPYDDAGVFRLSLTALDFPAHEVLHFLVSTAGPGAGPCAPPAAGVADCADILAPRQLYSGRLAADFTEMNILSPPVPVPSGTRVWLQVLSDTTHSPVVPYVIP